jgi:hypothetical protein
MMIKSRILRGVFLIVGCVVNLAQAGDYFNGFETDDACWFNVTPVVSGGGVLGAPSSSGSSHAEIVDPTGTTYTRFGGYGDGDTCDANATTLTFPANGYETSIDVYLDVDGGYANDSLLDYTAAINNETGTHRRDFIFNCGFYNDDQTSVGLGSGNRFICSASNNAPGWPSNPGRQPAVIATTSGWYTFLHRFYDDGTGVLAVDLSVLDSAGSLLSTWTLSDTSDEINITVGGNRYGWFATNQLGVLAIDNTSRSSIVVAPPAPIPVLGQYGMAVLAIFILLGGFIGIRRLA